MRLIDADALGVGLCSQDILSADYCAGWNGLISILENAPTVDAVPVVRCRECKWFAPNRLVWDRCIHQKGLYFATEDTFCSYGERREPDEEK